MFPGLEFSFRLRILFSYQVTREERIESFRFIQIAGKQIGFFFISETSRKELQNSNYCFVKLKMTGTRRTTSGG